MFKSMARRSASDNGQPMIVKRRNLTMVLVVANRRIDIIETIASSTCMVVVASNSSLAESRCVNRLSSDRSMETNSELGNNRRRGRRRGGRNTKRDKSGAKIASDACQWFEDGGPNAFEFWI